MTAGESQTYSTYFRVTQQDTEMLNFPPSPARSDCDSLADIEDLDAFLNAQGKLSHFPTPPKRKVQVTVEEIGGDGENESSGLDYSNIANCMVSQLCPFQTRGNGAVELVRRIILRARLPPEILAIAFNILSELSQRQSVQSISSSEVPPGLQILGALALATAYAEDHPYSFRYWSMYVSDNRWRGRRINEVAMGMLATLNWRLHDLARPQAVAEIMSLFESRLAVEVRMEPHSFDKPLDIDSAGMQKLAINTTLCVDTAATVWSHGLLTPDTTPTSIGVEDGPYLRLL